MTKAKPIRCGKCGYVIKKIGENEWAHKSKKHWVDKPHKAAP